MVGYHALASDFRLDGFGFRLATPLNHLVRKESGRLRDALPDDEVMEMFEFLVTEGERTPVFFCEKCLLVQSHPYTSHPNFSPLSNCCIPLGSNVGTR